MLAVSFPILIWFSKLTPCQGCLSDPRQVEPDLLGSLQSLGDHVFRWVPHTCRSGPIRKQSSRQTGHHYRRQLTALVFLPLQQHLCCVPGSINVKSELLKPELLIGMPSKPLVSPANLGHSGKPKNQRTKWQASQPQLDTFSCRCWIEERVSDQSSRERQKKYEYQVHWHPLPMGVGRQF